MRRKERTGSRRGAAGVKSLRGGSDSRPVQSGDSRTPKISTVKRAAGTPARKCIVGQQVFRAGGFLVEKSGSGGAERNVQK